MIDTRIFFAEVWNNPLVIPKSPLRKLELPTKSQLQGRSLLTIFSSPLALASFLAEVKQTFTNFHMAHHNLGSSRASPPTVTNATKIVSQSSSAQALTKRISLNPILDLSQITQTSQRGVGESSQRLKKKYVSWMAPAPSKGRRGKLLYLPLKN
jgi:hypothetical protein